MTYERAIHGTTGTAARTMATPRQRSVPEDLLKGCLFGLGEAAAQLCKLGWHLAGKHLEEILQSTLRERG